MKSITVKMLISLIGLASAVPFLAAALVISARAAALVQNAEGDLMLIALAFAGVALSVMNGFRQRMDKAARNLKAGNRSRRFAVTLLGF